MNMSQRPATSVGRRARRPTSVRKKKGSTRVPIRSAMSSASSRYIPCSRESALVKGALSGSAHTRRGAASPSPRSEEHTSELQSLTNLVCRLLLEKKKTNRDKHHPHNLDNLYCIHSKDIGGKLLPFEMLYEYMMNSAMQTSCMHNEQAEKYALEAM